MPQISIVIPIYNVEDYLQDSFSSLQDQTLSDIEIIAVDDGSTDGSLALLEGLARNDSRIKIATQKNAGPSAARNRGISLATAPIIAFMDADDRYKPYTCERIVAKFEECASRGEELDVLTFGAECFPKEASTPWHEQVLHPRDITYAPFEPELVFNESSRPFHWRTALRADFLQASGIVFNEDLRLGEDQVFHFAIYPRAHRSMLLSDELYEYRVCRSGSAMDVVTSDRASMMAKHLDIARVIFDDWKELGYLEKYPDQMASWLVEFLIYDTLSLDNDNRTKLLKEIGSFIGTYFSVGQIEQMSIPTSTKAILLSSVGQHTLSSGNARRLQAGYYIQKYGILSALKGAFRRIVKR